VVHIDSLKELSDIIVRGVTQQDSNPNEKIQSGKEVSPTPRDNQEDSRSYIGLDNIHPDRIHQVRKTILNLSDAELGESEPSRSSQVVKETEEPSRLS
jgi:hypothetical protein